MSTPSRLVLFVSVMPWSRQSLQPGILVSTSTPASPWGPKSSTPSECVLLHCARSVACDGLSLSTPCWHWSEQWSSPSWISVTRSLWVPAGPTAVRAECRRSACLLAPDVRTHNPTATGASLVTHPGTNPVPVVCSGVPLCVWHSTGVPVWQPAADIRDRRSSMSPLCWHHDTTLGDRAFPVAASRAWNSLPLETRACSSLLTFRRETKSHLFRQSYGWRGAVYSDSQQTSALSCATVLYLDFVKCPRNRVMAAL